MDQNRLCQHQVLCPYCSERMVLLVDPSCLSLHSEQTYVEDCQICCQPMLVTASVDDSGELSVGVQCENG